MIRKRALLTFVDPRKELYRNGGRYTDGGDSIPCIDRTSEFKVVALEAESCSSEVTSQTSCYAWKEGFAQRRGSRSRIEMT